MFQDLNAQGITILIVTHEDDISSYTRRIVEMRDGRIRNDGPVHKQIIAKTVLEISKEED